MSHRVLLCVLLLACLSFAPRVLADDAQNTETAAPAENVLLAYVDDQGRLHVVDSLDQVPAQYRDRVRPAKLGEVSTLSSQKGSRSKTRRSAQPRKQAPAQRHGEAAKEPAGKKRSKGRKARAQREKRMADLKEQRKQVIDELGLLEEGWLPPDKDAADGAARKEPSAAELGNRADALTRRLDELDKQIEALKSEK